MKLWNVVVVQHLSLMSHSLRLRCSGDMPTNQVYVRSMEFIRGRSHRIEAPIRSNKLGLTNITLLLC